MVNTFTVEALFAMVTNVNFDVDDIAVMLRPGESIAEYAHGEETTQ